MALNQPFKVCSRCGQRAVLTMVRCGRCGLPFPPLSQAYAVPEAAPGPDGQSPASQREVVRAYPGAPSRKRGALQPILVLLVFLVIFALAAGQLMVTVRRAVRTARGSAVAGATGSTAGFSDPTSGLFHERPGRSETPTVTVTNGAEGTLTLVLRSRTGTEYTVHSRPNEEARVRVPAGTYTLAVSSDLPWIRPNYGDATFQRYRDYDAYFVVDSFAPPVHLGD